MGEVVCIVDEAAIAGWVRDSPAMRSTLDLVIARATVTMKALIPVSPVFPVYAQPIPTRSSRGPVYQRRGAGLARPGGPSVSRTRHAGDLPLAPSGHLRNSVTVERVSPTEVLIGPTAPYAAYVNDGTDPHIIESTGPWPLRNRATGQVFGRIVHHPGTKGVHFIERTAESLLGVRVVIPN